MKSPVIAVALCALVFAPSVSLAQTGGAEETAPRHSRTARVTTRVPEPNKWDSASAPNGSRRIFKCRPQACPVPETVVFTFQKGSLTPPDNQMLERFANVELPKSIRAVAAARAVLTDSVEKIETLFSKVSRLKDYPSVLNETRLTRGAASVYFEIAVIFAGPVLIRIESSSPDRALAKKSLEQFVEVMQIVEGPPEPSPFNPRSPKTQTL